MAIYHVSLKKLSSARQRLVASTRPEIEAPVEPGSSVVGEVASAAAPVESVSTPPVGEGAGASADGGDTLAATVEELLQLPRSQVGALLAACNEPTRKVLLALIYRLAAVEDELRDVAGRVRSGGARVLQPAVFRSPPAPIDPQDGKLGLLEQVFQKNQSLRKRQ